MRVSSLWTCAVSGCLVAALAGTGRAAEISPQAVDAEVLFVEGMAALGEGRSEEAAGYFREAARLDPADGTYRYAFGLALLRLGRVEEAVPEIAASLEALRLRVDRGRVMQDLQQARRVAEGAPLGEIPLPEWWPRPIWAPPVWDGWVSVAAGWDSNPSLQSDELVLFGSDGERIDGSTGDSYGELALRVDRTFFQRPEGWGAGVGLAARQAVHPDLDALDFGAARAVIHLARGGDPRGWLDGPLGPARVPFGRDRLTALLQGSASHEWFGGDPYLTTFDAAAALAFQETAWTATGISALWSERDFSTDPTGGRRRSGRDLGLEVSQTFLLGRRGRSLRLGISALKRSAGRAEALARVEASAAAALPLAPRWTLGLRGAWRTDRFDHPESRIFGSGGEREDDTWIGSGELAWRATPRLRIVARGGSAGRSSDVDLEPGLPDLDFRRTTASLGLEWSLR